MELALIENLQREELNAIEEAEAYRVLIDDLQLTQNEVAERVGKQRTTVANALRLLGLPAGVKDMVRAGSDLDGTRSRSLGARGRQGDRGASRSGSSPRGSPSARSNRRRPDGQAPPRDRAPTKPVDPNVQAAEATLQRVLATKVRIGGNGKVGRIEIHYHSADELNRIFQLIVDAAKKAQ